jgi:hypothetical protein
MDKLLPESQTRDEQDKFPIFTPKIDVLKKIDATETF